MLNLRLILNIALCIDHAALGWHQEQARAFLIKQRGESLRHVHMKLLSYVMFYHPELRIEASASQHFKPDLVRLDAQGQPVQWVDCGQTSLKKLELISKRNRLTMIDIVKPAPGALSAYAQQAARRLSRPERVRYWSFEPGFLDALAPLLQGRHTVHAQISAYPARLRLHIDGRHTLATQLIQPKTGAEGDARYDRD